jgi:trehalose 6-phosphate synthase
LPGTTELLRSIASYDLIGVQTERDAENLRRSLTDELGGVPDGSGAVTVAGLKARVRCFPIGIDAGEIAQLAVRANSSRLVRQTSAGLGSRKLVIGVDRLDYSKGIPERMSAYERFLQDNPDQRGRVTYLQIAPTSRSEVPEYAALSRTVNESLGRINGSLGEPGWVPIHYVTSTYPRSVLAGLYRLASVGLVTPMRDGMNLVAKEYVAAQDPEDPGTLILSKFAGAAQHLRAALIVNPNDKVEVAEAIRDALQMSQADRVTRWRAPIEPIREHDVAWWAGAFLKSLQACSQSAFPAPKRVPAGW